MVDYEVLDFYEVDGVGFMLTVNVGTAQVAKFDRLHLKSPRGGVNINVAGIVPGKAGSGVMGIQPQFFDPTAVADGFRLKGDGSYEVTSLRLTDVLKETKKKWEFWK